MELSPVGAGKGTLAILALCRGAEGEVHLRELAHGTLSYGYGGVGKD